MRFNLESSNNDKYSYNVSYILILSTIIFFGNLTEEEKPKEKSGF